MPAATGGWYVELRATHTLRYWTGARDQTHRAPRSGQLRRHLHTIRASARSLIRRICGSYDRKPEAARASTTPSATRRRPRVHDDDHVARVPAARVVPTTTRRADVGTASTTRPRSTRRRRCRHSRPFGDHRAQDARRHPAQWPRCAVTNAVRERSRTRRVARWLGSSGRHRAGQRTGREHNGARPPVRLRSR